MSQRIAGYEVLDTLGRGGAGTVYRARSATGAIVAIKVLHDGSSAESVARFARERRVQGSLGESAGFVPLLDSGNDTTAGPYLVLPFLEGGTLRARLETGKLAVPEAVALGTALARTLGHAHAQDVVHRDLKPENVLFDAASRPFVADLGLAKHQTGPWRFSLRVVRDDDGPIEGLVLAADKGP